LPRYQYQENSPDLWIFHEPPIRRMKVPHSVLNSHRLSTISNDPLLKQISWIVWNLHHKHDQEIRFSEMLRVLKALQQSWKHWSKWLLCVTSQNQSRERTTITNKMSKLNNHLGIHHRKTTTQRQIFSLSELHEKFKKRMSDSTSIPFQTHDLRTNDFFPGYESILWIRNVAITNWEEWIRKEFMKWKKQKSGVYEGYFVNHNPFRWFGITKSSDLSVIGLSLRTMIRRFRWSHEWRREPITSHPEFARDKNWTSPITGKSSLRPIPGIFSKLKQRRDGISFGVRNSL
jgi:hypothetical protein